MKNETPRTQEVINGIADNPHNLQPLFDHARQLERELNAAKHDCGHAEKRCDAAIASWDEERERAQREAGRVVDLRDALRIASAALLLTRSHNDAALTAITNALSSPNFRDEQRARTENRPL